MDVVMCLSCGRFVVAIQEDDGLVPIRDRCRECGGTSFKDMRTGERIHTDSGDRS